MNIWPICLLPKMEFIAWVCDIYAWLNSWFSLLDFISRCQFVTAEPITQTFPRRLAPDPIRLPLQALNFIAQYWFIYLARERTLGTRLQYRKLRHCGGWHSSGPPPLLRSTQKFIRVCFPINISTTSSHLIHLAYSPSISVCVNTKWLVCFSQSFRFSRSRVCVQSWRLIFQDPDQVSFIL